MTLQEQIRLWLMDNQMGRAIEAMRTAANGTYYDNDTLLLMARWNRSNSQMSQGLISQSDHNLETNRLRSAALYTLELLEREVPDRLKQVVASPSIGGGQDPAFDPNTGTNTTPARPSQPVRLFISYSHKDEEFREQLQEHLAPLRLNGTIDDWTVQRLNAGDTWDKEIQAELTRTDVALYLISPALLNSRYIREVEIPHIKRRHEQDDAVMVPIIIRPCDFESTFFYRLHALPPGAKPISLWSNRDQAWVEVVKGLKKLFQSERFRA